MCYEITVHVVSKKLNDLFQAKSHLINRSQLLPLENKSNHTIFAMMYKMYNEHAHISGKSNMDSGVSSYKCLHFHPPVQCIIAHRKYIMYSLRYREGIQ